MPSKVEHEPMPRSKKRVTSVDVARAAGVSQSVVSRAFTPGGRVSTDTRKRVHAVAAELGYRPNILARNLVKRSTNITGIVMSDLMNPFYPYVLKIFTEKLRAMGHQVLLFSLTEPEEIQSVVATALQYQVAALIVVSVTMPSDVVQECSDNNLPVILFNRYVRAPRVRAVTCDNIEGGRLVANVLLDAGHRRLAFIGGRPDTSTNEDRLKGFSDRLQERGSALSAAVAKEYTYDWGFEAASSLLRDRGEAPDAIFCANDIVAIGALDAARHALGLEVPGDVSIIGFDDIPAAGWPPYALTTVRQPVDRMIDRTLALLVEALAAGQPALEASFDLIPGSLVVRSSARMATPEWGADGDVGRVREEALGG
jgi:DNA-binding LacI/PurR family transcriptional regulator